MPTSAEILVAFLAENGVDRCFNVPGESYIAIMDALHAHPTIDLVTARAEGGAGFMAVADARFTGKPGVALVSRGPGACNAAIAVHTAQQDAVPMLLIVGQVEARDLRARSFQEIDYSRMFDGIAKFVGDFTLGIAALSPGKCGFARRLIANREMRCFQSLLVAGE